MLALILSIVVSQSVPMPDPVSAWVASHPDKELVGWRLKAHRDFVDPWYLLKVYDSAPVLVNKFGVEISYLAWSQMLAQHNALYYGNIEPNLFDMSVEKKDEFFYVAVYGRVERPDVLPPQSSGDPTEWIVENSVVVSNWVASVNDATALQLIELGAEVIYKSLAAPIVYARVRGATITQGLKVSTAVDYVERADYASALYVAANESAKVPAFYSNGIVGSNSKIAIVEERIRTGSAATWFNPFLAPSQPGGDHSTVDPSCPLPTRGDLGIGGVTT